MAHSAERANFPTFCFTPTSLVSPNFTETFIHSSFHTHWMVAWMGKKAFLSIAPTRKIPRGLGSCSFQSNLSVRNSTIRHRDFSTFNCLRKQWIERVARNFKRESKALISEKILCHPLFFGSLPLPASISPYINFDQFITPLLKGCVRYIFTALFISMPRTCETRKNLFYFISKVLFVLEIIQV